MRRTPPDVALELGRDQSEIEELFDKWRKPLRLKRNGRIAPGLDKKIVTSWNGLAISALSNGFIVSGDEKYLAAAENAANFIWTSHTNPNGQLFRSSTDGHAANDGILDDYAFLAGGYLDLYEAGGDTIWLKRAIKLLEIAEQEFAHEDHGYYLTARHVEALLGRPVAFVDSVEPSGNLAILCTQLKIAAFTGNFESYENIQSTLNSYSGLMNQYLSGMAGWHDVALKAEGPFYEVVIAGNPTDDTTMSLVSEFHELNANFAVMIQVPQNGPDSELLSLLPTTDSRIALDGKATAYVCKFGVCQNPTSDPNVMRSQILQGWNR